MANEYGEGTGLSFIRYADIMLLYAEALTELNVDRNRDEIEKQLFELRDRQVLNLEMTRGTVYQQI